MVGPITRVPGNDYEAYQWQDVASVSKTKEVVKPASTYYKDTMQPCEPGSSRAEAAQRPVLATPEGHITRFSDSDIERLIITCLEAQKLSRMESGKTASENMLNEQKIKRKLHEKGNEIQDKANDAASVSKTSEWVGTALTAGSVAALLAALAFTFATGGASLAITAVQGGLLVAQGANGAVKSYYDYKGNQLSSELVGVKENRNESHRKMKAHMKLNKDSMEQINHYISMHKEVLKNQQDACHIQA